MAIEKKFLQKALDELQVKDYLFKELEKAGVSEVTLQKTPIATRITVLVRKPGMVVGKKGKAIKELCEDVERKFGIENPQFEVIEVQFPSLDARLMAEKIARRIETRPNFKPILRFAVKEIIEAGALGAEIRIAGKVVGKGGKAKTFTARAGYLKKSGEPMKQVRMAKYTVYLKAGAIGIRVRIVPPDIKLPDAIKLPVPKAEPVPVSVPESVPVAVSESVLVPEEPVEHATLEPETKTEPEKA